MTKIKYNVYFSTFFATKCTFDMIDKLLSLILSVNIVYISISLLMTVRVVGPIDNINEKN